MNTIPSQALQIDTIDVFNEAHNYLDGSRVFFGYFKAIPSVITMHRVKSSRLVKWISSEWCDSILIQHSKKYYSRGQKNLETMCIFFVLKSGLVINVEADCARIYYLPSDTGLANEAFMSFKRFLLNKTLAKNIHVVIQSSAGFDTTPIKMKKPSLNLKTHYNDDLFATHNRLLKVLSQKDSAGLVLFHGIPGTGKSTYIRYLLRSLKKRVIFLSPAIAGQLDAPSMTSLLVDNANSILVIEDAEELLTSRDAGRNSSISILLNLTDGLLGEGLGIQVIATFNTEIAKIDKALLRKGRLISLYEFKPLEWTKALALSAVLGNSRPTFHCNPTLAEIYNFNDPSYTAEPARSVIGFQPSNKPVGPKYISECQKIPF